MNVAERMSRLGTESAFEVLARARALERQGKDIVQLGSRGNGVATRWSFTEIAERSFRWLGHALAADGQTWNLEGEFVATRV